MLEVIEVGVLGHALLHAIQAGALGHAIEALVPNPWRGGLGRLTSGGWGCMGRGVGSLMG